MLTSITIFLIKILFDLYLFVIVLRLLLQLIHADYRNPVSQFVIKLTSPALAPLQKIIPEYRGIDFAIIMFALVVAAIKFILISAIAFHIFPNIGAVFLLAIFEILQKIVSIYFYAIIMRVIMGWLLPLHHNPIFFLVSRLVEPLLRPIRHVVPLVGGFDLSPLIALILLEVCSLMLTSFGNMAMAMF